MNFSDPMEDDSDVDDSDREALLRMFPMWPDIVPKFLQIGRGVLVRRKGLSKTYNDTFTGEIEWPPR